MPAQPAPLTDDEVDALWGDLTEAFSPGAPVLERDLFAGRITQLHTLIDSVQQRGRHSIVFGERGVGKTSLVNILKPALHSPTRPVVFAKVNADPEDTFNTLWKKIFKRMTFDVRTDTGGTTRRTLGENIYGEQSPDDVLLELGKIPAQYTPIVVIDEFDRLADERPRTLLADTIKALSDYSSSTTVVVVGVADDVSELIRGHQSLSRAVVQVKMPRMSQDELAQIIQSRYAKCGVACDEEALWKMTFLARGLPFYAQLLGLHSVRAAIADRRRTVCQADTTLGLKNAVNELDQTIKETYLTAIRSPRGDTLYAPILLACALAKGDELGDFQQTAVTEPLNRILPGKNYKPTTFAFHMNEFCEPSRKKVLERVGEARNYRYRFTDPLLQPFIIMKGLAEGLVDDLTAEVYANRRQLELSTAW